MPPSSDPWRHSRRRRDRFRDRIFTNDQGKGRHAEVAQAAHGLAHARTRHAGGRAVRRSNDCTRWCGGALRPFAGSAGRESTIFDGFNSVDCLDGSRQRGTRADAEPGRPGPVRERKGQGWQVVRGRRSRVLPRWARRRCREHLAAHHRRADARLNAAYGGFYGGAATGFSFKLVGVTRTDNAAWHFAGPTTSEERAMKQALHRGGWGTFNIYATTAGPYLGWAYLPGLPESQQYLDGLVVEAGRVERLCREVRPRPHGNPRGGPLVRPASYLPGVAAFPRLAFSRERMRGRLRAPSLRQKPYRSSFQKSASLW